MKNPLCLTLALVAGLVALPASAERTLDATPQARAYHDAAVARLQAQARSLPGPSAQSKRAKSQGNNRYPGTPLANEYRAYPPSCAAWPLPDKASGQTWSARMPLYARSSQSGQTGSEAVTITIWRIACSSSGLLTPYNTDHGFNAMTLMRIDRDATYEGDTEFYPTFPLLEIKQGGINYGTVASLVRAAAEPNTYVSDGPFDAPIIYSTTYVLENHYGVDALHYYNYAFKLKVDPYFSPNGTGAVEFTIPDYSPTQSSYPDAYAPLPLDGYAAAQWYNTEFNEGLLVQVAEQLQPNGSTVRQLVFDLLTQDNNGDPLWLVGSAAFPVGATSLSIDTIYLGNNLTHIPYGSVRVSMPDCSRLDVAFTPLANLPPQIPRITGTTTYDRLFSENGMTCE